MRERLLATKDANYDVAEYAGINSSGYNPVGDLIVIMVDSVSEYIGTTNKLVMTESNKARMDHGAKSGIIVAVGDDAFTWSSDRKRPFGVGRKPKAGDWVLFVRYAGEEHTGRDGKQYRIMSDNSVIAFIETEDDSNG